MKKEIKLRYGISFSCFLHASLVCVLLLCGARCETYTVGDEDNWSIGVNYLAWSTKYNFTVDDILGMYVYIYIYVYASFVPQVNFSFLRFP